jgi:hypothetical protein
MDLRISIGILLLINLTITFIDGQVVNGQRVRQATLKAGDLSFFVQDNSQSPRVLSGVQSLFNLRHAKDYDAFDPDTKGASAGLNFEHIISGHSNPANRFSPRHGTYNLFRLADGKSVALVRNQQDSPWAVSSILKYTLTAPHYIDVQFQCWPHDPQLFGTRGYAIFFFANYMNDVAEAAIHFLGAKGPRSAEEWIAADAPKAHAEWNGGGTYRNLKAGDLQYDGDHNFKLNIWSYDYPRYSRPFYYGLAAHGMVYMLMFDRANTEADEIRFSLFKFKLMREVDPEPRPAWDFQYVIHKVEKKEYGFNARIVWKKFEGRRDCIEEYTRWIKGLRERE